MATRQASGIGYLGWSWSGNGGGVEYLDMVTNFNPAQLTTWGQRIFNGANGIRATAREATIYGGGPGPTGSPSPSRIGVPVGVAQPVGVRASPSSPAPRRACTADLHAWSTSGRAASRAR